MGSEGAWYVYLLRCGDASLYAGVTTDPVRRLALHEAGRGARYTRGRGPFEWVGQAGPVSHGEALRWEAWLKRTPRYRKVTALRELAQACGNEHAATPSAPRKTL
jgi:putative endonuclease